MNSTNALLIVSLAAALTSGCYTRKIIITESAGAVSVSAQQPSPTELRTMEATPPPESTWVPGYWRATDSTWQWQPGRWMTIPAGYNTYLPGHWEQRPDGWVFHQGRWE